MGSADADVVQPAVVAEGDLAVGSITSGGLEAAVLRYPAFLAALDLGLIGPREELIVTRPGNFAPEFRARAIDLYRSSEGRTIAEVARELGIGTETFRKWVRQDEADRGGRDDR